MTKLIPSYITQTIHITHPIGHLYSHKDLAAWSRQPLYPNSYRTTPYPLPLCGNTEDSLNFNYSPDATPSKNLDSICPLCQLLRHTSDTKSYLVELGYDSWYIPGLLTEEVTDEELGLSHNMHFYKNATHFGLPKYQAKCLEVWNFVRYWCKARALTLKYLLFGDGYWD